MDADSSGESDDSESDNVKRRDRRGYIDTISNPAYFRKSWIRIRFENEVGDQSNQNQIPVSAPIPDRDSIFPTRNELSNNLRMRSKFYLIYFS